MRFLLVLVRLDPTKVPRWVGYRAAIAPETTKIALESNRVFIEPLRMLSRPESLQDARKFQGTTFEKRFTSSPGRTGEWYQGTITKAIDKLRGTAEEGKKIFEGLFFHVRSVCQCSSMYLFPSICCVNLRQNLCLTLLFWFWVLCDGRLPQGLYLWLAHAVRDLHLLSARAHICRSETSMRHSDISQQHLSL